MSADPQPYIFRLFHLQKCRRDFFLCSKGRESSSAFTSSQNSFPQCYYPVVILYHIIAFTKVDQVCMINSLLKSKDLVTEVTYPLIRIYNIKETSFTDQVKEDVDQVVCLERNQKSFSSQSTILTLHIQIQHYLCFPE